MKQPIIAPSILSADFANLQSELEWLNESEADLIHVDVMDGVFVPNISFGIPVCKAISSHTEKPLDVHLMIIEPEKYLEAFKLAGANILTVHIEACTHLHRTIQLIKSLDCMAGIALNPHTPVHALENIIHDIDLVCLMSVNPGFGGQKFISHTIEKISVLKKMINEKAPSVLIEVDGGVNTTNSGELVRAGADILVAGSAVFNAQDPAYTIQDLKNVME